MTEFSKEDLAAMGTVPDRIIALAKGISIGAVAKARRKRGIPASCPKRRPTPELIRHIADLYAAGVSDREICRICGIHRSLLGRHKDEIRHQKPKGVNAPTDIGILKNILLPSERAS